MFVVKLDANNIVISVAEISNATATLGEGWVKITPEEYSQVVIGAERNPDGTFTPPVEVTATVTEIDTVDFLDRFTEAEELKFEEIAEEHSPAGRGVRLLLRRLSTRNTVRLDNPRLLAGMEKLKLIGVAKGVWPDAATATARVSEILS
jgi:hypothetical protein